MSHYGVVFGSYWDGPTGRAIKRQGGPGAQLLGAYLISSPKANMLGLFHHPLADFYEYVAMGTAALLSAFRTLEETGFATYDARTEYVWVLEMARFRCGLKLGETALKPGDKRVTGVNRIYARLSPNPFLGQFYRKYRSVLHLERRRRDSGAAQPVWSPLEDHEAPSRPSQGPGKPGNQVPGTRYQDVRTPGRSARLRAQDLPGSSHESYHVISKLVRTVLEEEPTWESAVLVDLTEEIKTRCARHQIPYDSTTVARAIDSELAKVRGTTRRHQEVSP